MPQHLAIGFVVFFSRAAVYVNRYVRSTASKLAQRGNFTSQAKLQRCGIRASQADEIRYPLKCHGPTVKSMGREAEVRIVNKNNNTR